MAHSAIGTGAPAWYCEAVLEQGVSVAHPAFRFEKLKVYQRAREFSRRLYAITEALPNGLSEVRDTLRRHNTTIVLKIARGTAEPTRREAVATFRIAARSAELCESLLARLRLAGTAAPELEVAETLAGELHGTLDDIALRINSGARARDVFRDA
jgi:four helix bundle protein